MTLYPHQLNVLRAHPDKIKTQTDSKPQYWYDLDTEHESVRPGDRLTGFGDRPGRWQRPVTPGQCDCAGLRHALESIRNMGDRSTRTHEGFHKAIAIADEALAQPCTCAGKSAEAEEKERQYLLVATEALKCDPIPAWKRPDDKLEPPWEVMARMRRERDDARRKLSRLRAALEDAKDAIGAPIDTHQAQKAFSSVRAALNQTETKP